MATEPICPSCHKTLPPGAPLGLCPECLIKSGFKTGADPTAAAPERPRFVAPSAEEVAKLFPQLEIISLVGQGGMGAVYKARQPTLDRFVALKILPPGAADDAGFAERFNREARALAKLSHPHIVAVHDFGQVNGRPYLVMEFVDGSNLRQVEQAGRLTPAQALEIIPQICEALHFAHAEGIVHRDIKPENILIDKKGRVKITDFGIAKIVGVPTGKTALTGAKDIIGTPHYMAPEQVEHPQMVDHRADIYSLGVVFYEMLTGELPLGKFQSPSKKVQVDVRLDEVVLHTLEKEPERRYQHVSEVKTDVEHIAQTPPPSSTVSPAVTQRRHGLRVKSAILFFAAACFLVASVLFASSGNGVAAMLSVGAMIGLGFAGYGNLRAASVLDTTPGPPLSPQEIEAVRRQVKAPASWLVATGILNWVAIPFIVLVIMPYAIRSVGRGSAIFVLLGALFLSSAIIFAGLKMKRLEAYTLAILGSILAIFITPGNIIGLPIGIWSLVVLSRRDVREAFGKTRLLPPETAQAKHGWLWKAAVALVVAMALPVVALLSIIALRWWHSASQPPFVLSGSVTEAGSGKPVAGAHVTDNRYGAMATKGPSDAWTDANGDYALHTWPEEHTVTVYAPGYENQTATLSTSLWGGERTARMDIQLQPTNAPAPVSFGPVIERVVSRLEADKDGFVFFDLETGRVSKPPFPLLLRSSSGFKTAELTPELVQWVRTNDFDYLFHLEEKHWSRTPLDLKPMKGGSFLVAEIEQISANEVALVASDEKAAGVQWPAPVMNLRYDDRAPTFCSGFITRNDTKGIFQFAGIATTPPGVKIRYKLVQNAEAITTSPAPAISRADSTPSRFIPSETETIGLGNGVNMEFVLIHPGKFIMGCLTGAATHYPNEKPAHEVTITKPFYLGKFEVTQEQWDSVMDKNPSRFKGPKLPVENVSWDACHDFLFELQKKTRRRFALPTEAQWEYACRAGSQTDYSFGDSITDLTDYGWFATNSGGFTRPVGEKKPNSWGLYDMHGNVAEWCADWLDDYTTWPVTDPQGPMSSIYHVVRGGSWNTEPKWLRSTYRASDCQGYRRVGMRCVMLVEEVDVKSNPCPGFDASTRIPGFAMTCQECHVPRVGRPAPELKEKQDAQVCVNFMKFVVLAARSWAANHDGVMPPTLSTMFATLKSPSILVCPQLLFSPNYTNQLSWGHFNSKDVTYEIVSPGLRSGELTAVYLRCPIHKKVARVDGSVSDDVPSKPETETIDLGNGINMEFVLIHPGSFIMGCLTGDATNNVCERPAHEVRITRPFYLGKYEVTQEQWESVMDKNPSRFKGPKLPVDNVGWDACQDFLFELQKKTRRRFRLPTEAQWEYACRAGTQTAYSFGDAKGDVPDYGWFAPNSGSRTHPVGEKKPNPWGLYDMHGNVVEWCADWLGDYAPGSATDPQGPLSSIYHVARGGCWESQAKGLRSSNRASDCQGHQRMGLRCAMLVEEVDVKSNPCPGFDASARIPGFAMTCQECHVPRVGKPTPELKAKQDAQVCVNFMKFVVLAARSWAANHDGVMPPTLSKMFTTLKSPSILVCPQILFSPDYTNQLSWGHFDSKEVTYETVSSGLRSENLTAAYLRCPLHKKVARVDGSISDDVPSKPVKPTADSTARPSDENEGKSLDLGGGVKMEFILIRPGSFVMGTKTGSPSEYVDEKPAHKVTLTRPFYLGKFEVTQEQWERVMEVNPSHFKGPKLPVQNVSWEEAQMFLGKLGEKTGLTFALPTEAQWEYACRAATTTRYSFGENDADLGDYGWFADNSEGGPHPVGEKQPNPWGLHDMHGNVSEWCADGYVGYSAAEALDPRGRSAGNLRVIRGGGWTSEANGLRSSNRNSDWRGYQRTGLRVTTCCPIPKFGNTVTPSR